MDIGETVISVILFVGLFSSIIYLRHEMRKFRDEIYVGLGIKEIKRKSRGPRLLKADTVKRKARVIDETKLVKKEN